MKKVTKSCHSAEVKLPEDSQCHNRVKALVQKFPEVFSAQLGKCTKVKAKLHLKQDAIPSFSTPRRVPFAMKQGLKEELDRLVSYTCTIFY